MNVYEKLHAVMQNVATVTKDGTNDYHKYSYVREADLVKLIRPYFIEQGLLVFPVAQTTNTIETENGKFLTTVEMTFRFQNIDQKDDYIDMPVVGSGIDAGDKAAYKALTGAKKYLLLLSLLLESSDDPEADSSTDERAAGSGKTTKKVTRKKRSTKKVKEAANGSNGVDEEETVSPKISSFRKKAKGLKGGW